jgi:hypothetical protein
MSSVAGNLSTTVNKTLVDQLSIHLQNLHESLKLNIS